MPVMPAAQHHSHIGPIVATVIITLAITFGGLYFWGAHLNQQAQNQAADSTTYAQ